MAKEFTGRDLLYWLVLSFTVVIAVNVYFIVMSITTFRGEDVQKPYLQGVEYNRTLAERAEQEKLGWKATIGATRLTGGKVRVDVVLRQADGAPETQVALNGELRHPADETRDHTLRLQEIAAGQYSGVVSGVAAGAWDVVVSTPSGTPFEASRRVWVP